MSLSQEQILILLDAVGTLMIAFAALRVHHRVLYEHKIDKQVFAEMKHEQKVGLAGVVIIVISTFIKFFG